MRSWPDRTVKSSDAVPARLERIAAFAPHRGRRVLCEPAAGGNRLAGGVARREVGGGDPFLALGRPRQQQDVRVGEGGGEEQGRNNLVPFLVEPDYSRRRTMRRRGVARKSVVVEAAGRRYRLYPPGTYAKGNSSWWLDWHDNQGKRRRVSTWTTDLKMAERFALCVASDLSVDDARAALLQPPIRLKAAREIPRSTAEAEIIASWINPASYVAGHINKAMVCEAIINEAVAELSPREAVKILRRVTRGLQSGATFGARNLGIGAKNDVPALAAGQLEDRNNQVNAMS